MEGVRRVLDGYVEWWRGYLKEYWMGNIGYRRRYKLRCEGYCFNKTWSFVRSVTVNHDLDRYYSTPLQVLQVWFPIVCKT